jgi:hypothetical protein
MLSFTCVSMAAIFLQALNYKDKFPEAFETIAKASLVADMADSRPTKHEIKDLIQQLIEFFPLCAMEIRKFVGNTHSILKDLKAELRIKDLQEDLTLQEIFEAKRPTTKVKVLDLLWDYVQDVLKFDFTAVELAEMPITKMKMPILLHTLYDPLGILIPFCITGKLQVQDQETAWLKWQSQIDEMSTIEIP